MTFFGQAVHVMVKDVRQARWMLLGYLAVVAFATISALRVPQPDRQLFDLSMVVVVVAGMFVAAMLVQADSPIRSDSFWASRPLRPEAVLAAKGLSALLLLVGIPAVGVLAVLLANKIGAGTTASLLTRSASNYALWLLIAMVIAALTRDLRTYTTAVVVLPVIIGVLLMLAGNSRFFGNVSTLPRHGTTASYVSMAAIPIVGLGGALAILVTLYRTRTLRQLTWASAVLVIPALLVMIFATPPQLVSAKEPVVAVEQPPTFVVEVRSSADIPTSVGIGTGDPRQTDRLLMLDYATVTLRLGDGSKLRVPYESKAMLETARIPVPDVRWLAPRTSTSGGFQTLSLTRDQRDAVHEHGLTSASVEANVVAIEPSVVATIPLRAGTSHHDRGSSIHVRSVRRRDDAVAVVVRTFIGSAATEQTGIGLMPWYNPTKFVLVNRARGEAVIPGDDRSAGSSQGLILPGVWRRVESTSIQRVVAFNRVLPVDDEWLRNADLVVLDWQVKGRTKLTVEAELR